MDDADNGLVSPGLGALLQRDGNTGVRDAVSEIHRAVDRVNNPAILFLNRA